MDLTPISVPAELPKISKVDWMTKNMNKFCVLPWINLHTAPDGKVKLCCSIQFSSFVTNAVDTPFNFGYDSIESIWNSGNMRYTREMHRANKAFSACYECYNVEKISGHSPRMGQNEEWLKRKEKDEFTAEVVDDISREDVIDLDNLPISLELRLGNLCNLQCVTCYGLSSAPIYDERARLLEQGEVDGPEHSFLKKMWKHEKELVDATDVKNWYETDMFYENFRKIAPKLKRLYTTGGEPTLIKANYKMMQMLLDAGNTDCAIEFTSNMAAWNHEFYSRLEKFKNVEIQMSVDGADDIGAYVRYPSDMNRVKENIMKAVQMASTRPNWKVKCYTVLQALNYRHIVPVWEMLREAADTYAKHIDWWPITLYSPPQLSLAAIPMEARLTYLKEFKLLAAEFNSTVSYFRINDSTMIPCIDSIKNPEYDPTLHENLIRYVKVLDKSRNISGIELFKTELAR